LAMGLLVGLGLGLGAFRFGLRGPVPRAPSRRDDP
jgi:hypothetical protein